MRPIIKIEGVSKRYRLSPREHYSMLRDRIAAFYKAPARAVLSRFRHNGRRRVDQPSIWALQDVTVEVQPGEVLGIVGRNGAGKSTLLKILSRITEPTCGRVELYGRVGSLLEVGTGFHGELTGRENIFLSGAILGMRRVEIARKFDAIVAFAEIEEFIDSPVKHYSSGMYTRLAFAVAAHLEPEILLVDEILAVGDMAFQKKCLGKMGEVSRSGRTVLFVSHNMAAVENLCSRAIVLHTGKLHFDGAPKDAIQYYLNSLSTQSGSGNIIDLNGVGSRRSIVAPLLKRLEFYTESDQPLVEGLPIGARMKIRVHFNLPAPTNRFNIGLGFNNSYGQRIFTAHSMFEPDRSLKDHVGPQVFTCEVPSFTLMPGEYSVKVFMELKGSEADAIEDAAKIRVLESDYYGTGKVPINGTFVLKHRWYLEQAADAQ